jgi:hypothetical protein
MDVDHFWSLVDKSGECWIWTGTRDPQGYGVAYVPGVLGMRAHRVAYQLTYGPIASPRLFVCHRCDNPPCVRPDHMFKGTAKENAHDMKTKGRARYGGRKIADALGVQVTDLIENDPLPEQPAARS